jgi:hypothetical protein
MPECMPADVLVDAICPGNWPDTALHQVVRPITIGPVVILFIDRPTLRPDGETASETTNSQNPSLDLRWLPIAFSQLRM